MTSHPHFDDGGTLDWHLRWADALAAARAEDKKVFIEFGREMCSQCRTLVQAVVPSPGIAELMSAHFVGLASDCDAPEPQVVDLVSEHLADGMMLPFVLFTDAEGRFLAGAHGVVRPDTFRAMVEDVVG